MKVVCRRGRQADKLLRNERLKAILKAVREKGVQLTNTLTPTHFLKYECNLQLELLREIGKVNGLE